MAVTFSNGRFTFRGGSTVISNYALISSSPSIRQSVIQGNATNAVNITASWSSQPVQGNFLLMVANSDSVINSASSGWNLAVNATNNCACSMFYKVAGASENLTASINISAADVANIGLYEFQSVSGALDKVQGNTGQGNGTFNLFYCGPTTATAYTNELLVAVMGSDVSRTGQATWTDSFNGINSGSTTNGTVTVSMAVAYKITGSSGVAPTTTGSWSTATATSADVSLMATFGI